MDITRKRSCELCERDVPLTFHHLIPRMVHKRNYFKKRYNKEELNQGIDICRKCHSGIHKLYDEMTLAKDFDTLEKLQTDSAVQKHVGWVRKQKH